MKKLVSILAIVLAFTMMMSLTSFAAAEFKLTDEAVIPEGTTVTPAADSIAVTTAATAGNYYGILLVEGNALPTVDNAILYIDQATAADVEQAFSVLPIIPEVGKKLTLDISSNVTGANLIAIPMVYDAEEETIVPALGNVTGDVDADTGYDIVDFEDAYVLNLFDAWEFDRIVQEGYSQFWAFDAEENPYVPAEYASYMNVTGDVDGDTGYAIVDFEDAYVLNLFDAWEFDRIVQEGYEQFWAFDAEENPYVPR